jgi:hypothetical protein
VVSITPQHLYPQGKSPQYPVDKKTRCVQQQPPSRIKPQFFGLPAWNLVPILTGLSGSILLWYSPIIIQSIGILAIVCHQTFTVCISKLT